MNFFAGCAQLLEDPKEVYTGANSTAIRCLLSLPAVSEKKANTPIELNIYGRAAERFAKLKRNTGIYLHDSSLRYDIDTKKFSLHGGVIGLVQAETFPILNTLIISGRCVKDIHLDDERAFKTTSTGLMVCYQTLAVNTGRNQSDLFNFYAISSAEDKPNYAELLCNFTRKGTGLTVKGRLISETWIDKETKEKRIQTKIELKKMTLAPKALESSAQIKPQTTVASTDNIGSLWGGHTIDDQSGFISSEETELPPLPASPSSGFATDDNNPF